jgi:hypothetical protein
MLETHNFPEASSILAGSIVYPYLAMKDLSKVDMSDLAKEWESKMSTRIQAQLHSYLSLYGETASEPEQEDGVKTNKAELAPRPLWNAP